MEDSKTPKYNPDELRDALINQVFNNTLQKVTSASAQKTTSILEDTQIKRNLENDIFEVLTKYDISRDRAVEVVATFMTNLNRLK